MNQNELENRIKGLKSSIKINRVTFNSSKREFLKYAKQELSEKTKINISTELKEKVSFFSEVFKKIKVANFAIGSSAIALVIGGFTISASAGAMPGDPLYSLKLSMEKVQVALTLNDKDNIRLQVDITGKRIDELSKVVANKNANKKVAQDLVNTINSDLSSIPNKVSSLTTKESKTATAKENSDLMKETAKLVDDKISEYDNKLKGAKKLATDNGLSNLSNEIDNIGIKGNHVSVKTLNIVVQNINAELDNAAKEDIVKRVGAKIDNIKAIVGDEQKNTLSGYGYGQGGNGSGVTEQLDDIKTQLASMKVGVASFDEMSLLMNDIDKKLSNPNLILANPNQRYNDAIDLNKKIEVPVKIEDKTYGYGKVEESKMQSPALGYGEIKYGYGIEKKVDVKAEAIPGNQIMDTDFDTGSLWKPEE